MVPASAGVWLVATLQLFVLVGAPHGCGDHPSCDGNHTLTVNPLKSLPPLRKTHYSWAIYPPFMDNATVADGALVDYVRITGALTPTDTLQTTHGALTAVAICAKASAMEGCLKVGNRQTGFHCRAATITLSMSCLPGDCMHATKAGTNAFATCATKGAASLRGTLEAAQSALDAANAELGANVSVGAVTFDCESISWDTDTPPATLGALTLINEFTYNTTRVVFPDRSATRVIFYNFGAANWMPTVPHPSQKDTPHCDRSCRACNMTWHRAGGGAPLPLGWSIPSAYYTYLESFRAEVPYSPALYSVPEPELMRRQFSLTAAMAQASGATWVVPYIGLGWGLRRAVLVSAGSTKHGQEKYTGGYTSNEVNYQYDEGYDVLLGAQMHLPEFEHSAYGPWEAATAAVLYPSPFDETTYGNWPSRHTQGSTNSMDHFIAYVRGAAGITSNDKSG